MGYFPETYENQRTYMSIMRVAGEADRLSLRESPCPVLGWVVCLGFSSCFVGNKDAFQPWITFPLETMVLVHRAPMAHAGCHCRDHFISLLHFDNAIDLQFK